MMMDEAFINHYGKSAAARVDNALLVEHDAAALLPESFSSHRVKFFSQSAGLISQFLNRLRGNVRYDVALKQQGADSDHKKRGAIAGRYVYGNNLQ